MAQCAVSKSIIMAIEAYVKLFWGLVGGLMKLATPGGGVGFESAVHSI